MKVGGKQEGGRGREEGGREREEEGGRTRYEGRGQARGRERGRGGRGHTICDSVDRSSMYHSFSISASISTARKLSVIAVGPLRERPLTDRCPGGQTLILRGVEFIQTKHTIHKALSTDKNSHRLTNLACAC